MPEVTITLFTSYCGAGRIGKAEFRYVLSCAGAKIEGSGHLVNTTGGRLAMTALIEALKRMRKPSVITILTDCNYLIQGWQQAMEWEKNGWLRGNGKEVKNADLWKEIMRLQKGHAVRYQYKTQAEWV